MEAPENPVAAIKAKMRAKLVSDIQSTFRRGGQLKLKESFLGD